MHAGAVNNLLSLAAQRMEARTKSLPPSQRAQLTKPEPQDFYPESDSPGDPSAIFKDLIGCSQVSQGTTHG
jgi:hypothetical protein